MLERAFVIRVDAAIPAGYFARIASVDSGKGEETIAATTTPRDYNILIRDKGY